jgi:outer membrane lipoprotein-sorting protein
MHRKTTRYVTQIMTIITVMTGAATVPADDVGQPQGDEVVRFVNARDDGESLSRVMDITLTDKRGKTRTQTAKTFRRYYDGEKRSTIFYVSPANIKDTAFLTFDYLDDSEEDDQWLYLPELRRVRRISSSNRGDYYLGTDFTYEDMKLDTRLSADDYNWKTLGTAPVDGIECILIEGIPVDEKTANELEYGKLQAYVDPERWIQHKTDVWDVNGNHLKTVLWKDWELIDGIWVVRVMEATNHKSGHKTRFEFRGIDVQAPVPDEMFTERALRRGVSAE